MNWSSYSWFCRRKSANWGRSLVRLLLLRTPETWLRHGRGSSNISHLVSHPRSRRQNWVKWTVDDCKRYTCLLSKSHFLHSLSIVTFSIDFLLISICFKTEHSCASLLALLKLNDVNFTECYNNMKIGDLSLKINSCIIEFYTAPYFSTISIRTTFLY